MLYAVDTGKKITKLPHESNYVKWRKCISTADYARVRLGQNQPLKLKKDWNLSFFSNSSPFTLRKIKLQLYAAYIFLNLLPSKLNPFLFLL